MLGAVLPRRERLSDALSDERVERRCRQRLLLAATLSKARKAQLIPLLLEGLDRMLDASDLNILRLLAEATHALARRLQLLVVIRHAQRVNALCARANVRPPRFPFGE
mgnify:CR=1 FL=1